MKGGVTSRTHPSDFCDIQDRGAYGSREESTRRGKRRGEKQKDRDRDREESESETREKGGAWNQKEWWVVELVHLCASSRELSVASSRERDATGRVS